MPTRTSVRRAAAGAGGVPPGAAPKAAARPTTARTRGHIVGRYAKGDRAYDALKAKVEELLKEE
jgi:hypothetical protein